MRWDILEKFELLKKGTLARAVKSFSGEEDFFGEHQPGLPLVPEPLFLEMIAQTGGVLYGLEIGFKKEVILAKIEGARFPRAVKPPCRFTVEARIEEQREEGAWISGRVLQNLPAGQAGGTEVASAKIMLVAMDPLGTQGSTVFNDHFLSHYDIWNVAKRSEGVPV